MNITDWNIRPTLSPIECLNRLYGIGAQGSIHESCTIKQADTPTLPDTKHVLVEPILIDAAKKGLVFCTFLSIGAAYPVGNMLERCIYYSAKRAIATAQIYNRENGPLASDWS